MSEEFGCLLPSAGFQVAQTPSASDPQSSGRGSCLWNGGNAVHVALSGGKRCTFSPPIAVMMRGLPQSSIATCAGAVEMRPLQRCFPLSLDDLPLSSCDTCLCHIFTMGTLNLCFLPSNNSILASRSRGKYSYSQCRAPHYWPSSLQSKKSSDHPRFLSAT